MNGIATTLPIDLQRCRFFSRERVTGSGPHVPPCPAPRALAAAVSRAPCRCGYVPGRGVGADPDASRRGGG